MNDFKFIDLFSGIGGFHLALESLGGKCVLASEIDGYCKAVYKSNFPNTLIKGDIAKLNASSSNKSDFKEIMPDHDVLCAGFPCQPFSKAGKRLGLEDTRGTLFYHIAKIIERKRPEYAILENVPNLIGHNGGKTWETISNVLMKDLGYIFDPIPLKFSPHLLGIPQIRERVFILASNKQDFPSKHAFPVKVSRPMPPKCSINDDILSDDKKIDNINKYRLTNKEIDIVEMWNDFIKGIEGPLPGFPVWADQFREDYDISDLPKWKQNFLIKNRKLYRDNKEFIDGWFKRHDDLNHLHQTHTKFEWQAGDSERDLWKLIFHFRPSGLRVKRPDYFPALVAITQTSVVGKRKRRITPREAARLQSFPEDFVIHEDDRIAYKQFGNAVNVEVVKYLSSILLGIEYDKKVHRISEQISLYD
jgi:DNA (cytosine-5)-methyltransferase 1|tara:strand:+ start:396 stop:1649 length:1254 start_codon:yes stop_codon:yes gene_type:complete